MLPETIPMASEDAAADRTPSAIPVSATETPRELDLLPRVQREEIILFSHMEYYSYFIFLVGISDVVLAGIALGVSLYDTDQCFLTQSGVSFALGFLVLIQGLMVYMTLNCHVLRHNSLESPDKVEARPQATLLPSVQGDGTVVTSNGEAIDSRHASVTSLPSLRALAHCSSYDSNISSPPRKSTLVLKPRHAVPQPKDSIWRFSTSRGGASTPQASVILRRPALDRRSCISCRSFPIWIMSLFLMVVIAIGSSINYLFRIGDATAGSICGDKYYHLDASETHGGPDEGINAFKFTEWADLATLIFSVLVLCWAIFTTCRIQCLVDDEVQQNVQPTTIRGEDRALVPPIVPATARSSPGGASYTSSRSNVDASGHLVPRDDAVLPFPPAFTSKEPYLREWCRAMSPRGGGHDISMDRDSFDLIIDDTHNALSIQSAAHENDSGTSDPVVGHIYDISPEV